MYTVTRYFWNQTTRKICRGYPRLQRFQNLEFFSILRPSGGRESPVQIPELCIERVNGTENILEEDLYRYTRYRWLYNEQYELSRRYLRFNLEKLLDIAVEVAGEVAGRDAQKCTKVLKCSEGLHNKAFILTMDNGAEVFAKLPNPNAGPAHYTTASEVATRDFLREVFHIPVPQILAWSSDPNNPVEAEYTIEERAPGVRLGNLWNQWPWETKLKVITQVAEIENSLTSVTFMQHGCIYFKKDLQELTRDAPDMSINSSAPVAPQLLNRFSIGPLTSSELWKSGRTHMNLDRGPWRNPREYAQAVGQNEIAWIKSHATPRMNYSRSRKDPERPEDALSLLAQYMEMTSHVVPQDTDGSSSMVLWHPDLHLDNVFVDPTSHNILRIVDWQSAAVAPLFFQCGVPRMFRHHKPVRDGWVVPEPPDNFDALSDDEKKQVDADLESETIHKYYEAQIYKRAPHHWAALQQKTHSILRQPVWLVSGVWENRDLFFLRQSLISLGTHWDELYHELCPNNTPACPLKFSGQELELHSKEEENMDGVGQLLTIFRDQGVLPVDGMVEPQDYETAKQNSLKFKDIFVGLAKDEEERELFSKLWPYQDPQG